MGKLTADILRQLEDNFITAIKGHITKHELLANDAVKRCDTGAHDYYLVMLETYQGILKYYESSRRYGNA